MNGQELGTLQVSLMCRLDSAERYLAVGESRYSVLARVDRTPILRVEYLRDADSVPNAHIHVHTHRGSLSHLLSQAGHPTPHDISALHIPVGGARFRPALEDVAQFIIQECRFDGNPGW